MLKVCQFSIIIVFTGSLILHNQHTIADQSELLATYQADVARDPNSFMAHFNLAGALFNQHDLDGASYHYQRSITLEPKIASSHFNWGIVLAAQGKYDDAYKEFLETLTYNPNHTKARLKIIEYLQNKQQYDQAIAQCNVLIQNSATNREFEQKLANLYHAQGNLDDAILHFRKALLVDPTHSQLLLEYANTLNLHYSQEVAYEIYQAIQESGVDSLSVMYNIAYTLKKLDKLDEAIKTCKQVIARSKDYAQAHFALGTTYLTLGNFTEGWKEYEWRWKQGTMHERIFSQPLWDGSNLTGKTLYLHAEQGLGDTFQFIRYAKVAKDKGAYVIAAVQPCLVKIIALCPYIDKVIELGPIPKTFDAQAALMTVPHILNTQENTIPSMHPYLFAKQELIEFWKEKLSTDKKFKIGICWQGNPNYSTHFLRMAVTSKSMRPALFAPLGTIPEVSIYSLQKEHATNMDETVPEGFIIHHFDDNFDRDHGRFMDTAALMKNLDLVITVDTSIAHLAGGLGIPVWVILPKPADWRWLLDRTDSPWYPTMRLYRQKVTGTWTHVIDEIYDALAPFVKEYHAKKQKD